MNSCSSCGQVLGIGRYCTNCGLPVDSASADPPPVADTDWRTDTAERPSVPPAPQSPPPSTPPPRTPPPAPAGAAEPGPPRFPLFADEVDEPATSAPYTEVAEEAPDRKPRLWPIWLAVAAALLLIAALGFKMVSDDDAEEASGTTSESSKSPAKKDDPGKQKSDKATPSSPGDVTADATLDVPTTAPAGQDLKGKSIDYAATNMLDGIPATTWRMTGDGTGSEITITLPTETPMRSVGLINGYAKTDEGANGKEIDWYHGNRRIQQVEWVFDDGTTASQTLGDTTGVQSVDVDATTTTIVLRLVEVSAPGKGPSSRNYTAISDLQLISAG